MITNQGSVTNLEYERFQSYDLGCCASLICKGFELIDLDKTNLSKVLFIFRQHPELDKAVNDYWAGNLLVSARAMFENIKMLKNRIYSS